MAEQLKVLSRKVSDHKTNNRFHVANWDLRQSKGSLGGSLKKMAKNCVSGENYICLVDAIFFQFVIKCLAVHIENFGSLGFIVFDIFQGFDDQ